MAAARQITETGVVFPGFRKVLQGILLTAGSDAATLELRDGGATGDLIAKINAPASGTVYVPLPNISLRESLYAVLTGTSPIAVVYYN